MSNTIFDQFSNLELSILGEVIDVANETLVERYADTADSQGVKNLVEKSPAALNAMLNKADSVIQ